MNTMDLHEPYDTIMLDQFSSITNHDPLLMKQLLQALLEELRSFLASVESLEKGAPFEDFRKSSHKIFPSLKMLEQETLLSHISRLKEEHVSGKVRETEALHKMQAHIEYIIREITAVMQSL